MKILILFMILISSTGFARMTLNDKIACKVVQTNQEQNVPYSGREGRQNYSVPVMADCKCSVPDNMDCEMRCSNIKIQVYGAFKKSMDNGNKNKIELQKELKSNIDGYNAMLREACK
jgi:hypothetical protein